MQKVPACVSHFWSAPDTALAKRRSPPYIKRTSPPLLIRPCLHGAMPESWHALGLRVGVQPCALDPQRARALWQRSEEVVGERFQLKDKIVPTSTSNADL